jgi:hypothetical protein
MCDAALDARSNAAQRDQIRRRAPIGPWSLCSAGAPALSPPCGEPSQPSESLGAYPFVLPTEPGSAQLPARHISTPLVVERAGSELVGLGRAVEREVVRLEQPVDDLHERSDLAHARREVLRPLRSLHVHVERGDRAVYVVAVRHG